MKTYTLTGADGKSYQSETKGSFGGHRRDKIYGTLDCAGAARWLAKGHYVKQRVFFADEKAAIAAGYRPCFECLREKYEEWKANNRKLQMTKIHPTAIIEENVKIGTGTSVWDGVHIRHGATIGEECIVGEKTYIAYDVVIGNRVKINAMVYICAAVTIEDGVMISASVTFTNDRFPRATMPDLKTLRPSEPDEHTLPTLVREGATIGAGCIIGNDLEIGRWAMVGMGSVVTKSIPDFHLVLGSPARSVGAVCKCGQLFHRFSPEDAEEFEAKCAVCDLEYKIKNKIVKEINNEYSK